MINIKEIIKITKKARKEKRFEKHFAESAKKYLAELS